jgi:hypothetical protein
MPEETATPVRTIRLPGDASGTVPLAAGSCALSACLGMDAGNLRWQLKKIRCFCFGRGLKTGLKELEHGFACRLRVFSPAFQNEFGIPRNGKGEYVQNTLGVRPVFSVNKGNFSLELLRGFGEAGGRTRVQAVIVQDGHFCGKNIR